MLRGSRRHPACSAARRARIAPNAGSPGPEILHPSYRAPALARHHAQSRRLVRAGPAADQRATALSGVCGRPGLGTVSGRSSPRPVSAGRHRRDRFHRDVTLRSIPLRVFGTGWRDCSLGPVHKSRDGRPVRGRCVPSRTGAVRLQVEPDEARVFVDGYYAGIADDFNGRSQRLRLPPGRHEIVLKLEDYRTHRIKVYVPAGQPLSIHYRMAKAKGEDAEDLTPEGYLDGARGRGDRHGSFAGPAPDRAPDDVAGGERDESGGPGGGELRLSVRPGDAVIYVDGEFRGPGRQARRLELPPGRHSIEGGSAWLPDLRTQRRRGAGPAGRPQRGAATLRLMSDDATIACRGGEGLAVRQVGPPPLTSLDRTPGQARLRPGAEARVGRREGSP